MKGSKSNKRIHSRQEEVVDGSRGRPSAGTRIIAAIEEATEILRNEGLESKRLTIRTYTGSLVPHVCRSADVKRVRETLGASQAVLAAFLGVNVNTVQSWEQGKRIPQPIACRFLAEIESDPAYWREKRGRRGTEYGGRG
jgi:DNA-binding transcriptional regulator YiaG